MNKTNFKSEDSNKTSSFAISNKLFVDKNPLPELTRNARNAEHEAEMTMQILDSQGNVVESEKFKYTKFDNVVFKYDWMDGIETTRVKNGKTDKKYIPRTKQGEFLKNYMEMIAEQYVNTYMSKFIKAEDEIIKNKQPIKKIEKEGAE